MTDIETFSALNLWDIDVVAARLIAQEGMAYDFEIECSVSPWLLLPREQVGNDMQSVPAWLRFRRCHELKARVNISLWQALGPELGDQVAESIGDGSLVRYTVGLRATGSAFEVVAEAFEYEGPDITSKPRGPGQADPQSRLTDKSD